MAASGDWLSSPGYWMRREIFGHVQSLASLRSAMIIRRGKGEGGVERQWNRGIIEVRLSTVLKSNGGERRHLHDCSAESGTSPVAKDMYMTMNLQDIFMTNVTRSSM